jgi:hypothetical protein
MRSLRSLITLLVIVFCMIGCSRQAQLVYLPDAVQPSPRADLPEELRLKNWIGTDVDGDRGGSCAHASTRMVFRAAGAYELDRVWFEKAGQGYEGPESANRLLEKMHREGVIFGATEDGDQRLLEEASRTNRWATIFYYPGHSIAFCGFGRLDGVESAFLLDNNFPDYYIVVEKNTFLQSWKEIYGGFAVVPWNLTPTVSRTYPRTYRS